MSSATKRPFWLHQLAEYIVGGALLATGLQSSKPIVPVIVGSLIIVNTAVADAPFGAFRWVNRRLHRMLDYAVLAIAVVSCALPNLDNATRLMQVMIVLVLAVVITQTNYLPKVQRTQQKMSVTPDGKADELSRIAGRSAGTLASKIREKTRQLKET
ncbi:MAG: hypothetical protein WCG40_01160 [Actinomycetes bacterium]